jgi:hypothetical protein
VCPPVVRGGAGRGVSGHGGGVYGHLLRREGAPRTRAVIFSPPDTLECTLSAIPVGDGSFRRARDTHDGRGLVPLRRAFDGVPERFSRLRSLNNAGFGTRTHGPVWVGRGHPRRVDDTVALHSRQSFGRDFKIPNIRYMPVSGSPQPSNDRPSSSIFKC